MVPKGTCDPLMGEGVWEECIVKVEVHVREGVICVNYICREMFVFGVLVIRLRVFQPGSCDMACQS